MQLDFGTFVGDVEILTSLRPIPRVSYVMDYIKAYYLSENEVDSFIQRHRTVSRISRFALVLLIHTSDLQRTTNLQHHFVGARCQAWQEGARGPRSPPGRASENVERCRKNEICNYVLYTQATNDMRLNRVASLGLKQNEIKVGVI